jgi:CheY-like chemotaxis protein
LYAEFLQTWGFTVLTAANAVVAIDIARQQRPHVIVMDLSMPSLDGITAMTHLKRDPRTTRIPVIILTGYAARAIQDGALEAGADGFLTKPCLPEDLAQEVQRLVDSSDRPHPRYAS